MINQRQNLGILSEKKVYFKSNVLAITKLVELWGMGRQETEGTCFCLLCSLTQLWANTDSFFGSATVPYVPISLFSSTILYFILFLLDKMNFFVLRTSEFFPCLHLSNRKKKDEICSCSGVEAVMALCFLCCTF